ncbi:PREDICTED: polyadenylate-binding protein-interacting protein 1-like [Dinoponera quadriceps]|uniref:Polyadenylate-binding protein-interacting protein 1-like n=1 Tax=Dinoponera quadriceps TaxID=609295 RepID=A0A6P3X465_DINQU|nr:PREDICTED: polyadenylate-binding protein-interacting protein 1-like [Dinoponera quadriceps]XP_014473160.1 PREDICTED: polyadenylate-binding protein-interacting protein 1-like [Dinoponera quadriceps]XP_014473161.1 PREDICTED: polyadenylate-binding protein-interacting protein 1-like [Dinoponera quadriceps]XP_014473162.1 PREDICTED: polyadenylate-binding protein-interacting protein 1-like [Dinoponera quadriceps]
MDPLEGEKKDVYREAKMSGLGRGSISWLQTDNMGLRRPHIMSSNQSLDSIPSRSSEQSEQTPGKKQSKLSANAAVFIPKFPKSVQNRIDAARAAPPSVNSGLALIEDNTHDISLQQSLELQTNNSNSLNTNYDNYQNYSEVKEQEDVNVDDYNITMLQLERIMYTVTSSPGEFGNLIPPFVNNIRREGNTRYLRTFVTNIIDWSIAESNFRYNGARFCTYFDDTSEPDEQLLFRDILHYSCLLEARMQEFEWQRASDDSYDQKKCHGLILFLAELVAQMDETFAFTLGGLLIEFITKILKKPASNIVKYICQALKLAGQRLEKDKSKSTELESMMRALTELVTRGQLDTQVGNMVHSVHELRNDNWGRDPSHIDTSKTNATLSYQVQQVPTEPGASNYAFNSSKVNSVVPQLSDDALVYGPDGQIILTEEESKFLHEHIGGEQDSLDDVDYNYDDEIATAYEEFLRDKSK